MNIRYVIQARMSSTRLPGKILADIGGKPLIGHIVDRLLLSGATTDEIYLAMTEDDRAPLENFATSSHVGFIWGDTHNVLSRYVRAAEGMSDDDLVVRLTGDNPFVDFKLLSPVLRFLRDNPGVDFSYPWKLPIGMGFEVVRKKSLYRQLEYPLKPHHTEHVTTFIKENPALFRVEPCNFYPDPPEIRLTVDYPEDLAMARKTFAGFHVTGLDFFTTEDVLGLYRREPGFFADNLHMEQKKSTSYEKQ